MSDTDGSDHQSPKRPPLTIDLEPDPARAPAAPPAPFDNWYMLAAASAGVGGVLGLALSLTFAGTGLWPKPYRPEAASVARAAEPQAAAEIAALKAELAAGKTEAAGILARLEAQAKVLDTLKAAPIAAARPQPVPLIPDPRVDALETRMAKIETLPALVEPLPKAVDALSARIGDIAKAEPKHPLTDPAVVDRLKALEEIAKAEPKAPETDPAVLQRLKALEEITPQISQEIARLKSADATSVAGLADLAKRLDTELAGLSAGVKRVSGEISSAGQSRQDAVLALALSDLKAALDTGRPYAAELATARTAAPAIDLAALAPFADKGVPTLAQLKAKFPDVARKVLAAEHAAAQPGGTVDRFLANARQSLNIRRVDAAADETTEARLARLDTALAAGRAADAAREWQGLSGSVKTEALDFGAALRARATVDDLIATSMRSAMNRLSGQGQ